MRVSRREKKSLLLYPSYMNAKNISWQQDEYHVNVSLCGIFSKLAVKNIENIS